MPNWRQGLRSGLAAFRSDPLLVHLSAGSVVSMAVRVAGLFLALTAHLLLSRTLGAVQYGSYVIALGWAMVLVIPARLGLDNSVLRFATVYREESRADALRGLALFSLATILILSASISIILLLVRAAQLGPLRSIEWTLVVGVASLIFPLAMLGWLSALIRTANRIFASQFYEQALRPLLLIAGLGLAWLVGHRLNSAQAMLLTSATVVIAMVAIGLHARIAFRSLQSSHSSFADGRLWLSVSGTLFLMAVVQELLNQVDVILLGILANATEAGHFAAAWRLASLVPFGLVAIVTVSGPLIASAYRRDDKLELAQIARFNARFSIAFAAIVAVVLAAIGRPILSLFGSGFEEAYPALLILLVGGLVNAFTGSVGYLLSLTGHQRTALVILGGALLISISLNLLLIPRLGATGSAIAAASALSCWNLVMLASVRRLLGLDASAIGRRLPG